MSSKGEFAGYGFAAGDVRGTRAWKVDKLGRLTGVTFPQVWRPGENLAECKRTRPKVTPEYTTDYGYTTKTVCSCGSDSCRRMYSFGDARHQATITMDYSGITGSLYRSMLGLTETEPNPCDGMDPECKCGFYAYQEGSNDYYQPKESTPVGGVVQGYGKTILGSRGFRSEKARILALFVEGGAVKRIGMKLRLEALYAGVPIFTDYEAMLREFPPTPPEGYGSPADEDFWTRSADR